MDVMYDRKTGQRLEVFGIDVDHNTAIYYDSRLASSNGGNGWQKIQVRHLIPEAYYDKAGRAFMSKTERNDIKSHLTLVDAVWQCEDGMRFTHKALDQAIEHQKELMAKEEN